MTLDVTAGVGLIALSAVLLMYRAQEATCPTCPSTTASCPACPTCPSTALEMKVLPPPPSESDATQQVGILVPTEPPEGGRHVVLPLFEEAASRRGLFHYSTKIDGTVVELYGTEREGERGIDKLYTDDTISVPSIGEATVKLDAVRQPRFAY